MSPAAGQTWRVLESWSLGRGFDRVRGTDSIPGFTLAPSADWSGVTVAANRAASAPAVDLGVRELSAEAAGGGTQRHRFAVRNAGDATAPDARLTDVLPDDLELVSASSGSGPCARTADGAACVLGALDPGEQEVVEVVTRVRDADPGAQAVRATSSAPDADGSDDALSAASARMEPVGAAQPQGQPDAAAGPSGSVAPASPAAAEDGRAAGAPRLRARTLRVRRGAALALSRGSGLLRGAVPADRGALRVRVVRRSPGAAARAVAVRRDGRLAFRAPSRRARLWLDVVAVSATRKRSAPVRVWIVVR